jgi:hypothetical protein
MPESCCAPAGRFLCSGRMTDETSPTPQDIENARIRREIAARQAEEYAAAERLALAALGPGWTPWMKLSLIDSDYHRTGNTEPAATAYKVCRGKERLSEHSVYLRRMPDGQIMHADSYEPLFSGLLHEPHPTSTLEVQGQEVPCPRYSLCWSALELYEPRTAEQLAAARVKREQRAIENEARENPLFAEQIRAGEWRPEMRPHGRSPG